MTKSCIFKRKIGKAPMTLAMAFLLAAVGKAQTSGGATSNPTMGSDEPLKLEKFVVTGSHLSATAAEQPAVPVVSIGAPQIEASGEAISTLDLLRKQEPSISGIGSENATISTATTYGGAEINIHGEPVLVLLNGRRVATSAAESVGGNRFVDLNMIPTSAIERIDIVKDGSSAIYGSDAVGGVINIILKNNYNGWETGAHYGYAPTKGRYSERSAFVTGGVTNGDSSILVSFEYSKHDPIYFNARPYTNPYYGTEYYPGIIDVFDLSTYDDQNYMLNPKFNAPPGGGTYTIDQLVQMGYYIPLGKESDPGVPEKIQSGFNLADHQTLISNMTRRNLVVNGTHKMFGDSLEGFVDLSYSNSRTSTSLNAQPIYPYVSTPYTDGWNAGGTPPPAGTQYVPVTIPGNPFSQAWIDQGQDYDPDSGTGTGYAVTAHNRFVEYPRVFNNDSTLTRVNGGFRGNINEDYSWEVGAGISRYEITYTNDNVINTTAFLDALVAGKLNPFAITQAPGVLPGAILGTAWMQGTSSLSSADFVFRGTPFELPGGKLAFAVGGSYSREVLSASADIGSTNKLWMNSPSIKPISKQRKIEAVFVEVQVPLVGKDQQIPGIYSASADLAFRTEKYSRVGNSTVPRVSFQYLPIDDSLSFRFSAGKSFLAPALYDLFGPVNVGASDSINFRAYNSTSVQKNVQFESSGGSNPDLQPSKATSWSAGFGYTPKYAKGLTVTFDYFQTHQTGIIASPNQQTVAQSVEDLGAASPYVNFVHFGTADGPIATAPGQISVRPKSAVWLVTPLINLGGTLVKGFDTTVEYETRPAAYGSFDVRTTVTVFNSFQLQEMPTEPYYGYSGTVSQNEGTVARWKDYSDLVWKFHDLSVDLGYLYVPSVNDIGAGGIGSSAPVDVSSYNQVDLSVAYKFKNVKYLDGFSLRMGCNNLFNKMPPVALNAETQTNADVGYYGGAVGRMVYVDAGYKF